VGEWEACVQCGPIADEWAKPMPAKSKKVYAPERLEQLSRARAIKAAGDVRRRAERDDKVSKLQPLG